MTNLPHTDGECWCESCIYRAMTKEAMRLLGPKMGADVDILGVLTAARIRWQEMAVEELRTKLRAADTVMLTIDDAIESRQLNSRSRIADARLDYSEPFTERDAAAQREAELREALERARRVALEWCRNAGFQPGEPTDWDPAEPINVERLLQQMRSQHCDERSYCDMVTTNIETERDSLRTQLAAAQEALREIADLYNVRTDLEQWCVKKARAALETDR